jgi:endonuclease/exonuclease/phosphatase (EEP) superfamily protein YafD
MGLKSAKIAGSFQPAFRGINRPMVFRILIPFVTLAVAALLSLSLLGRLHPAFDSIAHFRGHLAALLGLAALLLFLIGFWKEGVIGLVFAAAALSSISSSFSLPGLTKVHAAFAPKDKTRAVYRLLQVNLRFDNQTPEKVLSLIGRTQPDAITLNEVSTKWIATLDRLSAAYPHRIVCQGTTRIGSVAILSRRPFENEIPARCFDRGSLALASINFGGQAVDVAALHLGWPWPYRQWAQVDDLAAALSTLSDTAILAGDFNAAGWSTAVRRVAEAGGLTALQSIGPTWLHRKLPKALRPWIGLPIDQVLVKGELIVHSAKTQDDVGSDHLPVLVEFSLLAGPQAPGEEAPTATVELSAKNGAAQLEQLKKGSKIGGYFFRAKIRPSTLPPSPCSFLSKRNCRLSYWR